VAGGTDLAVEANLRYTRFPHLISLEAIPELRIFSDTEEHVEIGAGLTLQEIASHWQAAPPVLHEWLTLFASPLIRNRATLGGNLATASPIGDSAPLLMAFDADLRIAGPVGERIQPLSEFFTAYRKATLQRGEVLVSIRLPKPFPELARFYKVAKRKLDDISTVAACLAVSLDRAGRVHQARLAYGGVAEVPLRAKQAEAALEGCRWNPSVPYQAHDAIAATVRPISDHRGSARYRLAMAQSLLEKFVYETTGQAA
jgi:xanthine dehydrogenase small subunit